MVYIRFGTGKGVVKATRRRHRKAKKGEAERQYSMGRASDGYSRARIVTRTGIGDAKGRAEQDTLPRGAMHNRRQQKNHGQEVDCEVKDGGRQRWLNGLKSKPNYSRPRNRSNATLSEDMQIGREQRQRRGVAFQDGRGKPEGIIRTRQLGERRDRE